MFGLRTLGQRVPSVVRTGLAAPIAGLPIVWRCHATFLLAAAISYTPSNTSVLQPPKAPAMAVWTSEPATREAVEFTAKDGSHIRGWIYRAKQVDDGGAVATHPFVLFFYGSNEDLVHEEARLAWLRDKLHVNAGRVD